MLNDLKLSRRRVLAMGSAIAATAVLAACGEADEEPAGNGGSSAGDSTATPEPEPSATPASFEPVFAADGEEPVIQISYEGGFLAVEDIIRRTPITALYNDGKLIYPGPVPEIFPQPALPNLLMTTLSDAGMQAVAEKVLETGLFEEGDKEFDSSAAILADAANTVFTVRVAGQGPVRVSAYALEFDADDSRLSDEEVEARRKLRELLSYLTGAPTGFPTDHIAEQETSYVPERLQIVTYSWDEVGYDFEMEPQTLTWPLDEAPSSLGHSFNLPGHDARCAVLEGDDLDLMLEALREANVLTRWEHLEEAAFLINRPLLPGEEACDHSFGPGDDPQTGGEIEHPTGDDELVLRYELTGGFVPLEWLVTSMPAHSLYGAGRMISEGAQIAIYPAPALPALAADQLTEEGIQMILAEADSAGLLQGEQTWNELTKFIADAHTGVLTINAKGETHVVSVYAPGMFDVGDMASDEEMESRAKFDDFVGKLSDLRGWLPEDVFQDVTDEYPADRLQIVSQQADSVPTGDDVQPNEIDWPLETPLSELGEPYTMLEMARCFVLEGDEFADVMSLLNDATAITRWISNDEEYVLHVRPLLPDEEGCQHPYQ